MSVIVKMFLFKVSCLVLALVGSVYTASLPVGKCKLEDSACLVPAFQTMVPIFIAGMPDLGVDVQDVLEIDDFKFDLAGLKFGVKDGRVKGLKNTVVDDVKWHTDKHMFTIMFHADVSIKGLYTASGRVLILPITGDGQMKLKLKHMEAKLNIFYEIVKAEDGKDHIKPNKFTVSFDVKDNAHFHLTNLFNGNKELSDTMLTFLNENWKQISNEFGEPVMDATAKKIYKNIAAFFEKMPLEEIAEV